MQGGRGAATGGNRSPAELAAAQALAAHIAFKGGILGMRDAMAFWDKHPEYQAVVPDFQKFINRHRDIIVLEKGDDLFSAVFRLPEVDTVRSLAEKKPQRKAKSSAAQDLAEFVKKKGGTMVGSQITQFYQEFSHHKGAISSKGVREFVEANDELLGFAEDGGAGLIFVKKKGTKPKPPSPAEDLAAFIKKKGTMTGAEMSQFYTEFPQHKAVITSKGLRDFVDANGELLGFAEDGGAGLLFVKQGGKGKGKGTANKKSDQQPAKAFSPPDRQDKGGKAAGKGDKKGEKKVCTFFLEGHCRNGLDCKYEHPSGGGKKAATSGKRSPAELAAARAFAAHIVKKGGYLEVPQAKRFWNKHPEHHAVVSDFPKFINRNKDYFVFLTGSAVFADEFRLPKEETVEKKPPRKAPADKKPGPQAQGQTKSTRECIHFLQGNCRHGDECRFEHPSHGVYHTLPSGWVKQAVLASLAAPQPFGNFEARRGRQGSGGCDSQ